MEQTITIVYGEALEYSKEITINEKQKAKKIISQFIRNNRIKKELYTVTAFGYKLVDARTGEDIDNNDCVYDSTGRNKFFLLPDERTIVNTRRIIWAVPCAVAFTLVRQAIQATGIILGGIPTAILALIAFSPVGIISKKIKNKIISQNSFLIDNYIIKSKISNNKQTVRPEKASFEKTNQAENNNQSNHSQNDLTKAEEMEETEHGFYFNNIVEFMLYCNEAKSVGKEIVWLKGDKYEKAFNDIYSAFERKKYGEVIYLGEKCFNINPVAISVRFEMCEAYLALGKPEYAEKTLIDMQRYMVTNYDVAHFYRKWGYILCEKKNWKAAAACYNYSLQFDSNPNAVMELAYIKQQGYSGDIRPEMIEDIFIENNIPLIKEEDIVSLDDLESQSNEQTDDIQEADNNISEENGTEKDVEENKEITSNNTVNVEEKEEKTVEVKPEIDEVKEIKTVEVEDSDKSNAESDDSIEKAPITPLPKVLFCRKCGAKLIDGSAFCNKCGTKI